MLKLIFLVLLCGCATPYNPKPSDTKFDDSKRDWISVYEKELQIAIKNQDDEACYFFLQEIVKLKSKLDGLEVPENPKLKILN